MRYALENKVKQGSAEFGVEFAGLLFLFDSETTRRIFLRDPARFCRWRDFWLSSETRRNCQAQLNINEKVNILILGEESPRRDFVIDFLRDEFRLKCIDPRELLEEKLKREFSADWEPETEPSVNNPLFWKSVCGFSRRNIQGLSYGKDIAADAAMTVVSEAMGLELGLRPEQLPKGVDFTREEANARLLRVKGKKSKKAKEEPIDFGIESFIPKRAETRALLRLLEREKEAQDQEDEEDLTESVLRRKEEKREEQNQLREQQEQVWSERVKRKWAPLKGFVFVNFPKTKADLEYLRTLGVEFDRVVQLDQTAEADSESVFPEHLGQLHRERDLVVNFILLNPSMAKIGKNIFNSESIDRPSVAANWQTICSRRTSRRV